MSGRGLERWLYQAVHDKPAPRAPRRKPRRGPMRSRAYRQWIRTQPSLVSGRYGCDPCHTLNNGLSSKGPDLTCVPLTREEHDEYDAGRAAFEAKYGVSMAAEVCRLNAMWFTGGR